MVYSNIAVIVDANHYKLNHFEIKEKVDVDTPYGRTKDGLWLGKIDDTNLVVLARGGKDQHAMPPSINYQANIWALKACSVKKVVSLSSAGSLRKHLKPGSIGVVSQYIDLTKRRESSFYSSQSSSRTVFGEPVCATLSTKFSGFSFAKNLTSVVIEGPRYNTLAESKMQQNFGGDLVCMTSMPEAVLAREIGLCYTDLALIADYDFGVGPKLPKKVIFENLQSSSDAVFLALGKVLKNLNFECLSCTPVDATNKGGGDGRIRTAE